jgi:hypothetical protein
MVRNIGEWNLFKLCFIQKTGILIAVSLFRSDVCSWQKISRAMNGRRTPRQVASRVQKYFEKLKKYGIEHA